MQYDKLEAWDERYTRDPSPFEWYADFVQLKSVIRDLIPHSTSILQVGCGTSELAEDMAEDGYKDMVSIDISPVAIQAKLGGHSKGTYRVGDVRNLSGFPSGKFGCVIDKGTLDTIMCSENSMADSAKMLQEIFRVLKSDGTYLCVSHAAPVRRMGGLERMPWMVSFRSVARTLPYIPTANGSSDSHSVSAPTESSPIFVYICSKKNGGVPTTIRT